MNRRSFLKSTAALAVASMVPTWLQPKAAPINLQAFCGQDKCLKGDLRTPFVQGIRDPHKYGTDGRICVRVPAPEEYLLADAVKRPPAERLAWNHDDLRGWQPWPRQDWLVAADSNCLSCNGYGVIPPLSGDCKRCDGMGRIYSGEWESTRIVKCPDCRGCGLAGKPCPDCREESPIGVRPGIQMIGGRYINAGFDRLVRRELGECEYVIHDVTLANGTAKKPWPVVFFRFDGGVGLLCSLDQDAARKRIQEGGG